ncbi:MAG: carbon storage regulator [Nitrospirota bacterium]
MRRAPLGNDSCILIVTRRLDEAIRIADDIVVTVKEVRRQPVRLRIEAPPNVPLYREEVTEEER